MGVIACGARTVEQQLIGAAAVHAAAADACDVSLAIGEILEKRLVRLFGTNVNAAATDARAGRQYCRHRWAGQCDDDEAGEKGDQDCFEIAKIR